jgi:hypothetical protein
VRTEARPTWQPFADADTSPEAQPSTSEAQPFTHAVEQSFRAAETYSESIRAAEPSAQPFAAASEALTDLDPTVDLVLVDDDAEQEQTIEELEPNVIELDLSTLVEDEEAIVKEFSVPNDPTATIASAVLAVVEAEEQAARAAQAQAVAAAPVAEAKNPEVQAKKKIDRDMSIPARLGVGQLWPAMDSCVAERRPAVSGDSHDSVAVADAAAAAAPSMPAPPRRRSKTKPIEDEWGFFDPEQCGFAALLAKLEEIADADDTPPGRRPA